VIRIREEIRIEELKEGEEFNRRGRGIREETREG